jgi:hypothetical protein
MRVRLYPGATLALLIALAAPANAASLNKCVDENGDITYSNLACAKTQAAKKIELDPAPVPEPRRAAPPVQYWVPVPVAPGQLPPGYVVAPPPGYPAPGSTTLPYAGQPYPGQLIPAPAPATVPSTTVPPAAALPRPTAPAEIITPATPDNPATPPRNANPSATPTPSPALADTLCQVLSQQVGEVLDRMDAARETASAEQMQTWQTQIQALEARKQASSCF